RGIDVAGRRPARSVRHPAHGRMDTPGAFSALLGHIGPNYAVCEAIVAAYRAESETQARIAGLEGERDGFGDFLAAGPALVKAVDLPDVIAETRQKSPATLTVYRTRKRGDLPAGDFTGDPVAVAGAWMAQQLDAWRFV